MKKNPNNMTGNSKVKTVNNLRLPDLAEDMLVQYCCYPDGFLTSSPRKFNLLCSAHKFKVNRFIIHMRKYKT